MNKDAREDHTLRNALLITATAAGGVAGAKYGIKVAGKEIIKAGTDKAIVNSVKKGAESAIEKVTGKKLTQAEASVEAKAASNIKKGPKSSTVKAAANATDKIKELEDFLKTLEVELEQYKRANNTAKVQETQKLIGQVKERLAKLKGF
jgi:DNA-directed RNA polymerase subunit L